MRSGTIKTIALILTLAIVFLAEAKPRRHNNDAVTRGIGSLVGGLVGAAQQQQAENYRQSELNARRQQAEIERQRRENELAARRQQDELARQETERERQRQLEFQRRQVEIERQRVDVERQRRKAEDSDGVGGISFNRWQFYLAIGGLVLAFLALFRR